MDNDVVREVFLPNLINRLIRNVVVYLFKLYPSYLIFYLKIMLVKNI